MVEGSLSRITRRAVLAVGAVALGIHSLGAEGAQEGASMDNANIKVVQDAYAAFGRGDVPAVIAMLTPDVTWESVGNPKDFPALGMHKGPAAVSEFFKLLGTLLTFQAFSPKDFYAAGSDMVFVLGHYDRTVIKTGEQANSDFVHVFTIRGGKIAAYREFADTATLADAWRGE